MWVQARINDLHGPGRLSYAEIARKAGLSKQYFGQVKDGAPPSDRLIEGLCNAFGPEPPKPPAGKRIVDAVKSPVEGVKAHDREAQLVDMVNRLLNTNDQLLTRLGTMERVMQSLWDEVRANRESLGTLPGEVARALKTSAR